MIEVRKPIRICKSHQRHNLLLSALLRPSLMRETLPIRNIDIGKTFCNCESTSNSFVTNGITLLVNELPILLFRTAVMVIKNVNDFLVCITVSI